MEQVLGFLGEYTTDIVSTFLAIWILPVVFKARVIWESYCVYVEVTQTLRGRAHLPLPME